LTYAQQDFAKELQQAVQKYPDASRGHSGALRRTVSCAAMTKNKRTAADGLFSTACQTGEEETS
jgi:hypothetical protein